MTVALGEALGLVVEADLDEFMVGYVAGDGAQHRVPLGAAWAVRSRRRADVAARRSGYGGQGGFKRIL